MEDVSEKLKRFFLTLDFHSRSSSKLTTHDGNKHSGPKGRITCYKIRKHKKKTIPKNIQLNKRQKKKEPPIGNIAGCLHHQGRKKKRVLSQ